MSSMRSHIQDPISQLDGDSLTFSMYHWEIENLKKRIGPSKIFLAILLEQTQKIKSLHWAICDLYPLITYSIKRVITDW